MQKFRVSLKIINKSLCNYYFFLQSMELSWVHAWRGNELQIVCQGVFRSLEELKAQIPSLVGVMECDRFGNILSDAIFISSQSRTLKGGVHYLACEKRRDGATTPLSTEPRYEVMYNTPHDAAQVEWYNEVSGNHETDSFANALHCPYQQKDLEPVPHYCQ